MIERPKLLTRVTVPAGGWSLKVYFSDASSLDTNITVTVPAGNYYIADDQQSDCILNALCSQLQTTITALGGNFQPYTYVWIDETSHKVMIKFENDGTAVYNKDAKLAWTESSSGLAAALGFDSSADDTYAAGNGAPYFTADWQHAYGWYADEDGYLRFAEVDDVPRASVEQAKTLTGVIKTQYLAESWSNRIELYAVTRGKTRSNGVGYGSSSVYPYERNEPLECWWREAVQGVPFRFYRNHRRNTADAAATGTPTGVASTSMTDSGASWDADPQRWKGCILGADGAEQQSPGVMGNIHWFVSANTATVLTVPAHPVESAGVTVASTYYIYDNRYSTYVLDVKNAPEFRPQEIASIDRFTIEIPVLRFET